MIDAQVTGRMGVTLVARAPVAVLATPGAQDAGAESLPGPRAVQGRCAGCGWTAERGRCSGYRAGSSQRRRRCRASSLEPSVRGTILTLVTLDFTPFDIAMSVSYGVYAVYSPAVLCLRDHVGPMS